MRIAHNYVFDSGALRRIVLMVAVLVASAALGAWLVGQSVASAQSNAPARPTGLVAVAQNGQVQSEWNDPDDSTITDWQVWTIISGEPPGTWGAKIPSSEITSSGGRMQYVATGLTNLVGYRFKVKAYRGGAKSKPSASSADVVPHPHGWSPRIPNNVRAVAGDGTITLSWDDPNDATITSYYYQRTNAPHDEVSAQYPLLNSHAKSMSGTISGLINGIEYCYRVHAGNNFGGLSRPSQNVCATPRAAIPQVIDLVVETLPGSGDTYQLNESIVVSVMFDRPVVVTGAPELVLNIGPRTRNARYHRFTDRPRRLTEFEYFVQSSDYDADGLSVAANALRLYGGTIQDAEGTDADLVIPPHMVIVNGREGTIDAEDMKVDGGGTEFPTVTGLEVTSSPRNGTIYSRGETIEVVVRLSSGVRLRESPDGASHPVLELKIGSGTREVMYPVTRQSRTSETDRLTFRYTVVATDTDSNGISIATDALRPFLVLLGESSTRRMVGLVWPIPSGDAFTDDSSHKVNGALVTSTQSRSPAESPETRESRSAEGKASVGRGVEGEASASRESASEPDPSVSVSVDGATPEMGVWIVMRAQIENPSDGTPSYQWQRQKASGWSDVRSDGDTKRLRFTSPGTRTYRVVVSYPGGESITSAPFSLTW